MDFESISLAARTQCHVMDGPPAAQQGDAFDFPVAGDRGLRKRHSLCDQDIGLWFLTYMKQDFEKARQARPELTTVGLCDLRVASCAIAAVPVLTSRSEGARQPHIVTKNEQPQQA